MIWRLAGPSLLLLAVAGESIILLSQSGHIANAGVCSQGAEPCCHRQLHIYEWSVTMYACPES